MTRFFNAVQAFSRFLHGIAGISLVFVMLLTCTDVVLRAFRHPIPGTFELVGFAGALAIGFAMPFTSWKRGHVYVDVFINKLPDTHRKLFETATRLLGVGLFGLLAWNLIRMGMDLRASGEVSPTLEMRFYPVVFGFAVASALQAVVLICDLIRVWRGAHE